MKEEWKQHPVYTNYWVSNLGRVLSINLLTLCRHKDHYYQCQMGRAKRKNVHSLVMETFVGPKPQGMVVRHLDGSRTNNRLDNLAYGTYEENCKDKFAHGRGNYGSRHGMAKLKEEDVVRIRELAKDGIRQKDMAKEFRVSRRAINKIISGGGWRHVV